MVLEGRARDSQTLLVFPLDFARVDARRLAPAGRRSYERAVRSRILDLTAAIGKILRRLHDVLLGARNRGTEEARRPAVRQFLRRRLRASIASARKVCRDFECEWLTSRTLAAHFRPDRIGALFMDDGELDEYRAVCAPARPLAWREPRVFAHLVAVAKTGRTVVAKAGLQAWRVFRLRRNGARRSDRRPISRQDIRRGRGVARPKKQC